MIEGSPEVWLGTSGFSFDDWVGAVYPKGLSRAGWLTYYEQEMGFNALEVNYTYYQMPARKTMEGLARKTSPAFRFTVKTHRSMTHDVLQPDDSIQDDPGAFEQFRQGVEPLLESGKFGCVLAQFPYGFVNGRQNREYLLKVIERLKDLHLVVEFRHRSWVVPEILDLLRKQGVGLCVVDEPALPKLIPWTEEATSPVGYVRFHGRNETAWFGTSTAERYNYLYSDSELKELAERVRALTRRAKTLYLFFNNCHAGAAARNARRFRELFAG